MAIADQRTAPEAAPPPMPWWVQQAVKVRTFQSLANPHFRTLWFGMLASYMAMQMNILARGYLAFQLSGSAATLGLVSMMRGLPQLFLSPFGGVIADRVDKRKLLIYTQVAMGALAAINAILIQLHLIQVWHLAALSLAEGFVFAFNMPSRQAIIPELVSDDELTNAVALNNAGMNFTRVVGPSLAGALIALGDYGMEAVFYLVALCYIGFIAQLWKLPSVRRVSRAAKAPFMQQLTGGIGYIIRTPALAALIGLAFVPILFGMPYQTLLPVFTERSLHVGAAQLGILSAASGVGALVGSLTVASLGGFKRRDLLQMGFGVIFGLALVGFALMPFFLASIVWIFLVGLAGNAYMALNSSMIMSTTERAYHGRVMSVYMMTWSLMPLSSLPLGKVVDAAGIEATMAVMGVVVAVFVAAIGATRLRRSAPVPVSA